MLTLRGVVPKYKKKKKIRSSKKWLQSKFPLTRYKNSQIPAKGQQVFQPCSINNTEAWQQIEENKNRIELPKSFQSTFKISRTFTHRVFSGELLDYLATYVLTIQAKKIIGLNNNLFELMKYFVVPGPLVSPSHRSLWMMQTWSDLDPHTCKGNFNWSASMQNKSKFTFSGYHTS